MKQGYVPAAYAVDEASKHTRINRILLTAILGILVIAVILVIILNGQKEPTKADLMAADAKARLEEIEQYNEEYNQMRLDAYEQAQAGLQELASIEDLMAELKTLVDSNGHIYDGNRSRVESIVKQINDFLGTTLSITDLPI